MNESDFLTFEECKQGKEAGWPQNLPFAWGYHGDCLIIDAMETFAEKDGGPLCAAYQKRG